MKDEGENVKVEGAWKKIITEELGKIKCEKVNTEGGGLLGKRERGGTEEGE